MQRNQNPWIATVAEQEIVINELRHELRTERLLQAGYAAQCARLQSRLQSWQTISMATAAGFNDLSNLSCQTLVRQLGWSAAAIISLREGQMRVVSSAQMTEAQLKRLQDSASSTPSFILAYQSGLAVSTVHSGSQQALALRVLFSTDNVIAVPLLKQETVNGYLIACQHGSTPLGADDEIEFLSQLARLIASAIRL